MAVSWSRPQAVKEKNAGSVTLAEIENLIMAARLAGAPDNAELKVDVVLEMKSPTRVTRATFVWGD